MLIFLGSIITTGITLHILLKSQLFTLVNAIINSYIMSFTPFSHSKSSSFTSVCVDTNNLESSQQSEKSKKVYTEDF